MVNGNFGHGRVRVNAYGPDELRVGDKVVPDARGRTGRGHQPGTIVKIRGDKAYVEWEPDGRQEKVPLRELVRFGA
jgi:hypothetical protein